MSIILNLVHWTAAHVCNFVAGAAAAAEAVKLSPRKQIVISGRIHTKLLNSSSKNNKNKKIPLFFVRHLPICFFCIRRVGTKVKILGIYFWHFIVWTVSGTCAIVNYTIFRPLMLLSSIRFQCIMHRQMTMESAERRIFFRFRFHSFRSASMGSNNTIHLCFIPAMRCYQLLNDSFTKYFPFGYAYVYRWKTCELK